MLAIFLAFWGLTALADVALADGPIVLECSSELLEPQFDFIDDCPEAAIARQINLKSQPDIDPCKSLLGVRQIFPDCDVQEKKLLDIQFQGKYLDALKIFSDRAFLQEILDQADPPVAEHTIVAITTPYSCSDIFVSSDLSLQVPVTPTCGITRSAYVNTFEITLKNPIHESAIAIQRYLEGLPIVIENELKVDILNRNSLFFSLTRNRGIKGGILNGAFCETISIFLSIDNDSRIAVFVVEGDHAQPNTPNPFTETCPKDPARYSSTNARKPNEVSDFANRLRREFNTEREEVLN
ncbi:hypothetical protein Xen7305DRAFT_00008930 [Xenococcus sp. PCC 7305]|nr:hypothetical protein Xen7305DRAFT_00008930 [Xenococcus sp. PCC 7305]